MLRLSLIISNCKNCCYLLEFNAAAEENVSIFSLVFAYLVQWMPFNGITLRSLCLIILTDVVLFYNKIIQQIDESAIFSSKITLTVITISGFYDFKITNIIIKNYWIGNSNLQLSLLLLLSPYELYIIAALQLS